jgi:superfamily II DNA or RNA helicase
MELWDHQREALKRLQNGSVLVGSTGSGKSLTALSYYIMILGDLIKSPEALYIITTAKKRDEKDWEVEARKLDITELVVDSWNNIKKYIEVSDALFIFDEQRLVGSGAWVKSFLKIARKNEWILLSATPADTWMDLIPVFIANRFYKNRTQFIREHVIYAPYVTYPKITGYRNEPKLKRYRDRIFVLMPVEKHTKSHTIRIKVSHNKEVLKEFLKTQWNPFTDKPVNNLSEETVSARKIINYHPSRIFELLKIHELVDKLIIFYNFNFELDVLRIWFGPRTVVAEWNGHKHQPIPETSDWVYLVQYKSGSEAWECFSTNHMAFYSLNYSRRSMIQARGRIDRHNTHYKNLYYYELVSDSYIDKAVLSAHKRKKDFNVNMLKKLKYK